MFLFALFWWCKPLYCVWIHWNFQKLSRLAFSQQSDSWKAACKSDRSRHFLMWKGEHLVNLLSVTKQNMLHYIAWYKLKGCRKSWEEYCWGGLSGWDFKHLCICKCFPLATKCDFKMQIFLVTAVQLLRKGTLLLTAAAWLFPNDIRIYLIELPTLTRFCNPITNGDLSRLMYLRLTVNPLYQGNAAKPSM